MKCLPLVLAAGAIAGSVMAQPSRVPKQIDNYRRVTLAGNTHPRARAGFDQGRVAPSLNLPYVTLTLAQTDSQKAELDQLLAEQQTAGSPNYHRWLSPEEYADRFGVSADDLNTIQGWLQGQGFKIAGVARGRSWIAFSGSAAQVEAAFQTEIHQYMVNGEMHFANATDPSIPAAFNGVVRSIHGLHDFRLKPSKRATLRPEYTGARGNHNISPNDLATIYDISPLYTAGIDGTGQKLVVAGQTQVNLSDIEQFRTRFGLSANDPQTLLVPNSRNPGVSSDDVPEADLDLEWSGAVARNAQITFVYSFNVMDAVQYAIDQNLAPVVSVSYGSCELETPSSDAAAFQSWAKQGNAQGITWIAASGDAGAADCDDSQNPGLAVDLPGSIPQVTSMGGTEFAEGTGTFWSATNDASGASALSYIPETTWNDSAIDGEPSAGGGGASILFTKPSWQTGPGVPNDNARHVPDVSLSSSADHDGFLVYTGGSLQVYGGTSVASPSFAGMMALLSHYLVSSGAQASPGVGNVNPNLYSLAQTNPSAFHDITSGNNVVTVACTSRLRTCVATAVGFNAGAGYDQATGLGSVDAYKLITGWNGGGSSGATAPTSSLTLLTNLHNITATEVTYLIATVTGTGGLTPTGSVTFEANGSPIGSATLVGSAGTATATLAVTGSQLPLGTGTITAQYTGTSNNPSASVTVSVSSSGTGSTQTPTIAALANAASYQQAFSPGGIAALFGSNFSTGSQGASSVPLPISMAGVAVLVNGVAAPLYYVSSGLVNIQIPYETAVGNATVTINNNGAVTTQSVAITATAPGIFMDQNRLLVPVNSATRGQLVSLYVTGTGAVSPAVATGAAPAASTALSALPDPTAPIAVTVGGVPATVQFQGVPWGLVGVTQINIFVPTAVGLGAQQVVITVGGVASSPVTLNVTG